MDTSIFQWFNSFLSKEWAVFFTACLPILELRGAIPVGIAMNMSPLKVFFIAVLGNALPVIPLLLFLEPVRDFLIKNSRYMEKFFACLYKRTIRKSDKVKKYGAIALILFTAVPLPTTGAWTASLAAVIFKIKLRRAFPAILMGIIISGIIITISSMALFQ